MKITLRPLNEQAMVITGASSGVGRATAKAAAARGARVVLASRNKAALDDLVEEIKASGGEAVAVRADVGVQEDVQKIVDTAKTAYGGIETWVNNAGVSIFGKIDDVAIEDQRQLFETNYWGVVYGSLAALEHLRPTGAALINVGSVVSETAIPLQGVYSASKHAVKGFTDALRMELEADNRPISVTLIKPASLDTAFTKHAKNYLDVEPKLVPPLYRPEAVADAILYAAEHPTRDLYVGSASKLMASAGKTIPGVMDHLSGRLASAQRSRQPAQDRRDALWEAGEDAPQESYTDRHVLHNSIYTDMQTRWRGLMVAGVATTAGYMALRAALRMMNGRK